MIEVIDIQIIEFGSDLQRESVELRTRVLREPLGLIYTAEQLAEEKEEIHIIAVLNGKVIGILLLKKINNLILKMRQVAVDINLQKSGVGKKLVEFSEQYALKNNFKKIELHARDNAKDFYKKLNYKMIEEPFVEVGLLHYKMEKQL